jgi:hypothetical protein
VDLEQVRVDLAALVEGCTPTTVAVYDRIVDQIAVPAVLVGWADPWIEPATLCGDHWVRAELLVVAGRIEPGDQIARLEQIVAAIIPKLSGYTIDRTSAPFRLQIAGVDYLAASIVVAVEN